MTQSTTQPHLDTQMNAAKRAALRAVREFIVTDIRRQRGEFEPQSSRDYRSRGKGQSK